jgi:hypothetical protein
MTAKDAIKRALISTQGLLAWYVSDLSDADLLLRPVPSANHIAWQLGHLILAEQSLCRDYLPQAKYPELPIGFSGQHGKDTAAMEPPKGFLTKSEYLELFNGSREATVAGLDALADEDLDKPTSGRMAQFAPTVAALLLLQANHTTMHSGQFSVVRRMLGKPILF